MRSINVNKKGKTMKKTLKEKAAIFRTKAVMLKEQNVRLQNGMSNVSEQNKSLELEVEKLKSALVVKDLQKDLDHSEEKHKLKDKLIKVLEERPKDVKVEVQQPVHSNGYAVLDNNTTGTSITTTANGSAGFLR
jgi:succinate dehydrogenase/fumarate reductase-like Fe-S protein